jgi:tetratricopeptide (TPR) repeat protein
MPPRITLDGGDDGRGRAKVFFDRGKTVADSGNFEYAIEMYIQGLSIDPENVEAHRALRAISLRRKISGGRDMGMIDKMKMVKPNDDKQAMLNAEKLLAYVPGDIDRMRAFHQAAEAGGFAATAAWICAILRAGLQ